RNRDHQCDRRDDQHQGRNDQAGDAEKGPDGLALTGHQIDAAQRLRNPDHARQADQDQRKRRERRAEDILVDRPHRYRTVPPCALDQRLSTKSLKNRDPRWSRRQPSSRLLSHYHPFDPSTKWPSHGTLRIWLTIQADVAGRPRRRWAVRRLTGHSAANHLSCSIQAATQENKTRIIRLVWTRSGSLKQPTILEDLPMSDAVKVGFVPFSAASRGILVVFCDDALKLGGSSRKALGTAANTIKRAAATNQFKGKSASTLDIRAPGRIQAQRLIGFGAGKPSALNEKDFLKFGGLIAGKLNAASDAVTIFAELADGAMQPEQAAAIASGIRLRAYRFDRYKTKKKDGENGAQRADISIAVGDVGAARKAFAPQSHFVDGVIIPRELVNEPPNVLYPTEFARRASQLKKLGVDVDVLDVKAMTKLGMGALLGVGQGSTQPSRTVIMRWNGGKKGEQPVAFIGKGVCFDTGGISIKGAASMEDMKGDMGGAACV